MRNLSLILNVVLVAAVGVLFYLQFAGSGKSRAKAKGDSKDSAAVQKDFKVAYFVMDSLENNYEYFKDARADLKNREEAAREEMERLKRNYQNRMEQLNKKAPTMSQTEAEAAQREEAQLRSTIQSREQSLQQEMMTMTENLRKKINEKIGAVLETYNKTKGYAFIVTDQPGFIYYKDAAYDITADVLKGLNEEYKSSKK
jgi:outer membrane protein